MLSDETMYQMPEGIETRWASPENWDGKRGAAGKVCDGRKGSACFELKAGGARVLAHAENTSGTVRRIWATINDRSPKMLRGLRLDMYWDGAEKPAVSAPFGDFFGQGLGRTVPFESALFSNPEGRSFNASVPMPFRTGMKIVATNETDTDIAMFFYDVNYTLGDPHDETALYLHAHWRRERPTILKKDYEFLPRVEGRGRFLGVNVGVIADTETYFKSWWGEGECKIYLDGDKEFPTLCGTGTEDYIGTAWGQGRYAHLYQGCHLADEENYQYNFYRYHIPDPIYFQREIRITMHQIGCWGPDAIKEMEQAGRELSSTRGTPVDMAAAVAAGGYGLFERQDDWSSCAYLYLDRPENDLPALAPVAERTIGLLESEGGRARADA
ncbi:MAG: glycoside hydrolase family 172 protein [Planctomycetota bacterium]